MRKAWFMAGLLLIACKPKVRDLPVCPAMVAAEKANESETQQLPVDVWFSILVKGFNRTAMAAPEEPRECSNRLIAVTWPENLKEDPRATARQMEPRARTDADITLAQTEDGAVLAWARIYELSNGDAVGPVAMVRWVEKGLEVRGIGTVQAPPGRAKLRLEALGEDAQVLIIESETCPEDKGPCTREVQLLPLVDQRFVGAPLVEDGVDVGPARFIMTDSFEEPLKDGWTRKYIMQRRLEVEAGSAIIEESIKTRDCDPKNPATPCDERIAAQEKRALVFEEGRFVVGPSPWKQVGARRAKGQ
jgi:hypothetical protein